MKTKRIKKLAQQVKLIIDLFKVIVEILKELNS